MFFLSSSKIIFLCLSKIDLVLEENSVAMLSPAAASLDQFKSYAHRGDEFKNLVDSLS